MVTKRIGFTLAAALAALLSAGQLHAAGFDCAKAASSAEKAVCADPGLNDLDGKLADAYRKSMAGAADAATKDALKLAQRDFLKRRDACADAACMKAAYEQRLAALATPSASGGLADSKTAQAPAGPSSATTEAKPQTKAAKPPQPGKSPADDAASLAKRQALYEKLNWPKDCEEDFKFRFRDLPGSIVLRDAAEVAEGVTIYPLGGGASLAIAECDSFAYQISFAAVVFDETGKTPPKTVSFKEYDRNTNGKVITGTTQVMAGWPEFDTKTKTLTIFTKARGIGDCGSYTVYGFDTGTPVLRDARAQACFDDERKWIIDPAKWPKVEKP